MAQSRLERKSVRVSVKAADIKYGLTKSIHYCPIARAASRAFGMLYYVEAYGGPELKVKVYAGLSLDTIRYRIPKKAENFTERFDAGKPVKPFTFVARLVESQK